MTAPLTPRDLAADMLAAPDPAAVLRAHAFATQGRDRTGAPFLGPAVGGGYGRVHAVGHGAEGRGGTAAEAVAAWARAVCAAPREARATEPVAIAAAPAPAQAEMAL